MLRRLIVLAFGIVLAFAMSVAGSVPVRASPPRLVIAWNAYGDVERWSRKFARFVEAGDYVLVVEGNGGKPVSPSRALDDFAKVSAGLRALGKRDLHFGIYTSDLANVRSLASSLMGNSAIELIGYGYEPGYAAEFPKGPEGGWVFTTALANVRTAAGVAHRAKKKLMVIPTGRPLLAGELAKYDWSYPDFIRKAGADLVLVQTQTFIYQHRFSAALDVLDKQIGSDRALRDRIIVQVTIEPERIANRNGVSPEVGAAAAAEALRRGYRTISLWHAYRDTDSARAWIGKIGR